MSRDDFTGEPFRTRAVSPDVAAERVPFPVLESRGRLSVQEGTLPVRTRTSGSNEKYRGEGFARARRTAPLHAMDDPHDRQAERPPVRPHRDHTRGVARRLLRQGRHADLQGFRLRAGLLIMPSRY
jgi:hypothetical protein